MKRENGCGGRRERVKGEKDKGEPKGREVWYSGTVHQLILAFFIWVAQAEEGETNTDTDTK